MKNVSECWFSNAKYFKDKECFYIYYFFIILQLLFTILIIKNNEIIIKRW